MFTFTTYGSWLRGDKHGWVANGKIRIPNSELQKKDLANLKYPPYNFDEKIFEDVGEALRTVIVLELEMNIYALSVNPTHIHFVVGEITISIPDLVRKVKDAVRQKLHESRAIWTKGYDKRFCFKIEDVITRINYVQNHRFNSEKCITKWDFLCKF